MLVDDEVLIDGGVMGFMGILPSAGKVRSLVRQKLGAPPADPHGA